MIMERLSYLDFEIKIERKGEDYIVESPAGKPSGRFVMPFSDDEVEYLVLKAGHGRGRAGRVRSTREMKAIREIGEKLFISLFSGDLLERFRSSTDEIHRRNVEQYETDNRKTGLRFKLMLQDVPELAGLPWEFLFDADLNRFLCHSNETPIVRYIELSQRIRPFTVEKLPLQVLAVISNPNEGGYARLDVENEKSLLMEAIGPLEDKGRIAVTWLKNAPLGDIRSHLRNGVCHVFHFIGHGEFDEKSGEGVLVMRKEGGGIHKVDARRVGVLLHDCPSLRLAVLNSCEGARFPRANLFAGVATTLIQQGIPAVAAMQFEITDTVAKKFAGEFYSALTEGFPVDASMAEARKAIYMDQSDVEWGTPVLYTRSPDGVLFSLPERPVDEEPPDDAVRLFIESSSGDPVECEVLIDTRVGELAAAFFEERGWPMYDVQGRRQHAVAEFIDSANPRRARHLKNEDSVNEAGLRNGDVVRIFSESADNYKDFT